MQTGDKVKFIHSEKEGTITRLIDNKTIAVSIENGTEIPVSKSDVIVMLPESIDAPFSFTDRPTLLARLQELAEIANGLVEGRLEKIELKADDEVGHVEKFLYEIAHNLEIQRRRQSTLYAATSVLSGTDDLSEAMPGILKAISEGLGWQWAAMWTIDRDAAVLRCGKTWQDPDVQLKEFSDLTQSFTFKYGDGLIGRVWELEQPAWVTDVQLYPNFLRLAAAQKVGLHAALCFPIYTAHGILGVMEFLTSKKEEPDNSLLAMMNAIGSQIGQFIERKLAQELSLKKAEELEEMHLRLEKDFASRMRDSLRLKAQHAATKVLADAPGLSEATPLLLEAICDGLGWECALMWKVDEQSNVLQWVDYWHVEDGDFSEFDIMSRNMTFARGLGLPGRVWDTGEPLWILDVVKDTNFPRAPAAEKADLHGAFAFPVRLENTVLGVMEFFSRKIQEPDDALLAMMAAVGSQIGQFIERKNAESKASIYLQEVKKQKDEIEQRNEELNQQNEEIAAQRDEIELQKHLVDEKQKEVMDSINYAQRIQRALLASDNFLNTHLPEHFVFFQPKDIVSGDFYWASKTVHSQESKVESTGLQTNISQPFVLVTADSTGHGVPGAIMSMLNISCLNEAVNGQKLSAPNEILNYTRSKIIEHLSNDGSATGGKDGMDCSLLSFDFSLNQLTYAAANNPVWIVRSTPLSSRESKTELLEFAPDKMPVGKHDRDNISFTQHAVELQKGDVVYTLTDGMPDQFGGPRGKKFMYKQLKELLVNISSLPMQEQKQVLEKTINAWKEGHEQVDDILLIGVRV